MLSISVIIPAYNRAQLIGETLRSLLDQTVPAVEIIVVDDGSCDGTSDVAASFGHPVKVIRQENRGPAAARNRGFSEARGDFIHFFDSDDIALPNKHEFQLRALEESDAHIAYGPWVKGRLDEHGFAPENHVLQQKGLPSGDLIKALLTNWSTVPHACLFRRTIVEKVGGFPEELFVAEDQLMFLRCLLAGALVVHSPGTLELYRTNDAGKITAADPSSKARHFREWARFLVMARNECMAQGIDPRQWFGFRRRAWEARRNFGSLESPDLGLLDQLDAVLRGHSGSAVYPASQWLETKLEGLQARLTGGRAHHSFCMGRISQAQRSLIAEMGLELRNCSESQNPT